MGENWAGGTTDEMRSSGRPAHRAIANCGLEGHRAVIGFGGTGHVRHALTTTIRGALAESARRPLDWAGNGISITLTGGSGNILLRDAGL